MKNAKTVILIIILIAVAGVAAWGLWPRTALMTETKPVAAQPAATPVAPKPVAVAAVELPKVAAAKPADAPAPKVNTVQNGPISINQSEANRQIARNNRREAFENEMQSNLAWLQRQIDSTADNKKRQELIGDLDEMRKATKERLDQLSLPPPPPIDLGTITLAENTPVKLPLDNGGILLLDLLTDNDGTLQIRIQIRNTFLGDESFTSAWRPATSDKPIKVSLEDYEINFIPQISPNTPLKTDQTVPAGVNPTRLSP